MRLARASLFAAAVACAPSASPAELGAPVRLTFHVAEDRTPRCAPDSRRVAFASEREGSLDLFVLELDGGGPPARLTRTPVADGSPAWSPDGGSIAFHRGGPAGADPGLWVLELATGAERQLLADDSDEVTPEWSRDGAHLYFSSARTGAVEIHRLALADGHVEQLTDSGYRDVWPRVSPAGDELLFFSRRATEGASDEVYRLALGADAGAPVRVTTHPDHHDFTPDWSPDGRRIVTAESGESRQLAILSQGGERLERFASGYHRVFQPSWCGDGRIVYAARVDSESRADLYGVTETRE